MAVGLTVVEPLAAVDVKVPGVMATDVAPLVVQASVEDCPAVIEPGVAVNEEKLGAEGVVLSETVMTKSSLPERAPSEAVRRRV